MSYDLGFRSNINHKDRYVINLVLLDYRRKYLSGFQRYPMAPGDSYFQRSIFLRIPSFVDQPDCSNSQEISKSQMNTNQLVRNRNLQQLKRFRFFQEGNQPVIHPCLESLSYPKLPSQFLRRI